ncbi:uncharacterized protein TM35_000641280 [Trypanosoma theileri]|uniref:Mucin-associated surface protein (MASP) n=1 Tax=Trypanosoma theileri TaxID=67003 RepID=A0A1X0NFV5_9TRYP|nr:uncharacterized protein TM35_000641280 [Trypanosoma theileri]ORC83596.1 hypothetical protein TM35_000641280 [Trypanosoma theileri]
MMMMMHRVMCVLAVVLCCACGYTMAAAAAVDNDSPSGRGVSRGAVEVSCGAGGALRVRPAAESEWLTCGAGSRVSACGKYADLCRQRTGRTATARTTTIPTTTTNGQPKAVIVSLGFDFPSPTLKDEDFKEDERPDVGQSNTLGVVKGREAGRDHINTKSQGDGALHTQDDELVRTSLKEREDALARSSGVMPVPNRPLEGGGDNNTVTSNEVVNSHIQQQQHLQQPSLDVSGDAGRSDASTILEENNRSPGGISRDAAAHSASSPAAPGNAGSTLSPDAAQQKNAQQATPNAETTLLSTTETQSTEGIDSNQGTQRAESESSTEGNYGSTSNHQPATTISQENGNLASPATTNTNIDTSTTSPAPLSDPHLSSNITSTVLKKANVDSSINPVWMRTAAPLLIVAVMFSATL